MLSKLVNAGNDKIKSIEYYDRTKLDLFDNNGNKISLKLKVSTHHMQVICQMFINDRIFHSHIVMDDENTKAWQQLLNRHHYMLDLESQDFSDDQKLVWQDLTEGA